MQAGGKRQRDAVLHAADHLRLEAARVDGEPGVDDDQDFRYARARHAVGDRPAGRGRGAVDFGEDRDRALVLAVNRDSLSCPRRHGLAPVAGVDPALWGAEDGEIRLRLELCGHAHGRSVAQAGGRGGGEFAVAGRLAVRTGHDAVLGGQPGRVSAPLGGRDLNEPLAGDRGGRPDREVHAPHGVGPAGQLVHQEFRPGVRQGDRDLAEREVSSGCGGEGTAAFACSGWIRSAVQLTATVSVGAATR